MESQNSPLKEYLLQLLDPDTTPEKALQSFSYPCFNPEAYTKMHMDPVVIFLAYIRFIINRRPDACVNGIWEKILRKTLIYTRNISRNDINCFLDIIVQNAYTGVVPTDPEELPVSIWVGRILCSKLNCPNPYTRLELFRLFRIYERNWLSGGRNPWDRKRLSAIDWRKFCNTFIQTVSEIQPHRLYPSGNADDLMFCVTDMEIFVRYVIDVVHLTVNSSDIISYLSKNNDLFVKSPETIYIVHCVQSIGIFAVMAKSNPNFDKHMSDIVDCFYILKLIVNCGGTLDNRDGQFTALHLEERLHYVVTLPPFRDYIIEALRDLSTAVVNSCERDLALPLAYLRDIVVWNLGVSTNTTDLPRLLLCRQAEGSTVVHRHLPLLKKFSREKRDLDEFDFEWDNDWLYSFIGDYMNKYLQSYDDIESVSESVSDNINNISRINDHDRYVWGEDSSDNDGNITQSSDASEDNTDTTSSVASSEHNEHLNE